MKDEIILGNSLWSDRTGRVSQLPEKQFPIGVKDKGIMKKLFAGLLLSVLTTTAFAADEVKINHNGTDGLVVESDGTLLAEGAATCWDDLRVPMSALKQGKVAPDSEDFPYGGGTSGVLMDWFSASTMNEMYFVVQMPHSWAEGTEIMPHIHWTPSQDGAASKTTVQWGLDYSWLNLGDTHSSYTLLTGSVTVPADALLVKSRHYLTPLKTSGGTGILGTGKTISSMLICRIYRLPTASEDTFEGKAGVLEVDFHYQINTIGSRLEYTK
jgi:hypothetical protein